MTSIMIQIMMGILSAFGLIVCIKIIKKLHNEDIQISHGIALGMLASIIIHGVFLFALLLYWKDMVFKYFGW